MARPKKAAILEEAKEIELALEEAIDFDEDEEKFSESDIADIADLAEEIIKDSRPAPKEDALRILQGDIQDLKTATTSIALALSRSEATFERGTNVLENLVNERFSELLARISEVCVRLESLEKSPAPAAPPATVKTEPVKEENPAAATIRQWLKKLPKGTQYSLNKVATTIASKLGLTDKEVAAIVSSQTDLVVVADGQVMVEG